MLQPFVNTEAAHTADYQNDTSMQVNKHTLNNADEKRNFIYKHDKADDVDRTTSCLATCAYFTTVLPALEALLGLP